MSGGGGILQLVAQGPSDAYLTSRPEITWFKSVFRRHTPFATESYAQAFLGDVNFGKRSTVQLAKTGDLAGCCWLEITLPDLTAFAFDLPDSSTLPRQPRILKTVFLQKNHCSFEVDLSTFSSFPSPDAMVGAFMYVKYKAATTPSKRLALNVFSAKSVVGDNGKGTYVDVNGLPQTNYKLVDRFETRVFISGAYVAPSGAAPGIKGAYVDTLSKQLAVGTVGGTETYSVTFWDYSGPTPVELLTVPGSASSFSGSDGSAWFTCDVAQQITAASDFRVEIRSATRPSLFAAIDGVLSNPRTTYNLKWCDAVGFAALRSIELEIGGARIDYYERVWQDIWSELFVSTDKKPGLYSCVGKYTALSSGVDAYDIWDWTKSYAGARTYYVPLLFFNRVLGQAIPMCALQFHDVRFNIEWAPFAELIKSDTRLGTLTPSPAPQLSARFFTDITYVDTPERNLFATSAHEYLVTVCQSNYGTPVIASLSAGQSRKFDLAFTNPIKELIFVFVSDANLSADPVNGNNHFRYDLPGMFTSEDLFSSAKILLNGNDRFLARGPAYFRLLQPFQHHSFASTKKIYLYSFALHPENTTQPSGHLNASRIDSLQLQLTLSPSCPDGQLFVFAPTWNILSVKNGMAGLVFARTG